MNGISLTCNTFEWFRDVLGKLFIDVEVVTTSISWKVVLFHRLQARSLKVICASANILVSVSIPIENQNQTITPDKSCFAIVFLMHCYITIPRNIH